MSKTLCLMLTFGLLPGVFAQEAPHTYRFTNTPSAVGFEEVQKIIQYVGMSTGVSVDLAAATISFNGRPADLSASEWLVRELDRPPLSNDGAVYPVHEYRVPGSRAPLIRVIPLRYTEGSQGLVELETTVRVNAQIPFTNVYSRAGMIVIRGAATEPDAATWLIEQLELAASPQAAESGARLAGMHEYRVPGGNVILRVFFPVNGDKPQRLEEMVKAIRNSAGKVSGFGNAWSHAVVVRGTRAQIDAADKIVTERDRLAAR